MHPLFITHLCAHDALVHDLADPAKCLIWISPTLEQEDAEQVVAACRLAAKKIGENNEFPYAFSSPEGFFDRDMKFEPGPGKLGLTCATFVLAVFNAVQIDLTKYRSWPIRPDDPTWREGIAHQVGMPPDLLAAVRKEKIIPRYHPLEVAGAAARDQYPVPFRTARKYARRLRTILRRIRFI